MEQIVHEVIDGEVILINLATGTYFSLEGSGAETWQLLHAGTPPAEAASRLAERHGADPDAVRAHLEALVADLRRNGLLPGAPSDAAAEPPADADLGTFEAPRLLVYTDMAEFLLVDPIHEADPEAGWPHAGAA